MSDPSNPVRLEVVGVLRNGRRRYDPASKRRLIEACLQPGVSLAGVAMRHGVNANLLRKWVTGQQQRQRSGVAVAAIGCATEVFVPVVELCGVAGPPEPPAPPSVQHHVQPAKAACHTDPPAPRLTVEMPNGVTLRLECTCEVVFVSNDKVAALVACYDGKRTVGDCCSGCGAPTVVASL
jgi:transposase